MNAIEDRLYTLTDDADSLASELFNTLESIRYDPVGAGPDDTEAMRELRVRHNCEIRAIGRGI